MLSPYLVVHGSCASDWIHVIWARGTSGLRPYAGGVSQVVFNVLILNDYAEPVSPADLVVLG